MKEKLYAVAICDRATDCIPNAKHEDVMKVVSCAEVENRGEIYTVMLEPGVYVDVKRNIDGLCYVMYCEDGYMTFDDNGNTFDYKFNEDDVIRFVDLNSK